MAWREIPFDTPLRAYEPPVLQVECARCKRTATDLSVQKLAHRFGKNIVVVASSPEGESRPTGSRKPANAALGPGSGRRGIGLT